MKTIVVPIDFSDATDCVIDAAAALAGSMAARIVLLHVAEPEPQFVGYDPGPISVRVAVAGDIHADQRRLEAYREKLAPVDVLALHVQGATPEEILKMAREHAADYIVMGSHGHGAIYHLLVGSVTGAVLKGAHCPVLVVPGKIAGKI